MRRIHRFTITLSFCSRDDRVLSKMRIKVSLVSTSLAERILFSMVVLLTFSAHMFLPLRYRIAPVLFLGSELPVGN